MALTVKVTKERVTLTQPGRYSVTVRLQCSEGLTEVIDQEFDIERSASETIAAKATLVVGKMQEAIEKYKAEQQVLGSFDVDNTVAVIQAALKG